MNAETSAYQALKIWIETGSGLHRDVLHVLIGAGILVICLAIWRGPRGVLWALVLSLLIGVGMEVMDRRDNLASLGIWLWRASLADLLRTVAVPLCAFGFSAWMRSRRL